MHIINEINYHPELFHSQDKERKQLWITEYFKALSSFQILGPEHYDKRTFSSLLCADKKISRLQFSTVSPRLSVIDDSSSFLTFSISGKLPLQYSVKI